MLECFSHGLGELNIPGDHADTIGMAWYGSGRTPCQPAPSEKLLLQETPEWWGLELAELHNKKVQDSLNCPTSQGSLCSIGHVLHQHQSWHCSTIICNIKQLFVALCHFLYIVDLRNPYVSRSGKKMCLHWTVVVLIFWIEGYSKLCRMRYCTFDPVCCSGSCSNT